jgi:hypothetical protein
MEIRSLIILAAKADSEGNFRVADRLTAKIETMSREARGIDLRFLGPLTKDLIKGLTSGFKPKATATHTEKFKGKFFTPEDYKKVVDSHNAELAANAAARKGPGAAAPGQQAPGTAAPGVPTPGQTQTQYQNVYMNPPTPGQRGKTGNKGKDGRDGIDGAQGIQGLKGDTGPAGRAGAWWPGLVAGLLSGAIGTGGVAAWLISKGADNAVVRDMENHLGRLPQFQMMTRRTDSGDLTGAKAIRAQNFVDTNSTNPRLKNQRDWYNFALQESGGDSNFANNVISLVKATPQMPSSIGGGSNI